MGDDLESHRFFYSAPKNKKNGGYYQGMPTSSDVTKKQYPNFYNFEKEYNNVSKQGDVEFRNGKKPEELLKFLIQIFTKSNDIVLDYHLGSGTTAAVAHKLGRQYIGLEQLQSQIDLTQQRIKNVINGDQTGISEDEDVKWQGGGSFVYLELKKYNQNFIEQIEEAKDTEALLQVWEQMKAKSFLNYNVDIKKQEEHIEESYSPDFAYVLKFKDGEQKLNFIVETKDVNSKDGLRDEEKFKIKHAEKFFDGKVKIEFKTQFSNNKIVDLIKELSVNE